MYRRINLSDCQMSACYFLFFTKEVKLFGKRKILLLIRGEKEI